MRADRDAAIAKGRIGPLANGSVDIAIVAVEGETRGNHAHDGVGLAIEPERLADDVRRRAELAAPESAAQNHRRGCAKLIVFGSERPAQNGTHAQGGKELRGNQVAAD